MNAQKLQELLASKLGRFAQQGGQLLLADEKGEPMDSIVYGKTVVTAPFKLVTKDQIARVTGIVTESMLNANSKDGASVYRFQGNGWEPEALLGDILLQDVDNPADRWACGQSLFGGTGWIGTVQADLSVTYAKPGKPLIAIALPAGITVTSREGTRVSKTGEVLAFTKADKGDFYLWTTDVVASYVRDYQG
jgi:hypothetical protein